MSLGDHGHRSPPLLTGQSLARWLLFPVRPHIDMAASRSALRAGDLTRERRHLGIGGIARYVDEALMSARVAEAGGDKMMHTKVAHVA
jgi:hypothetical protein